MATLDRELSFGHLSSSGCPTPAATTAQLDEITPSPFSLPVQQAICSPRQQQWRAPLVAHSGLQYEQSERYYAQHELAGEVSTSYSSGHTSEGSPSRNPRQRKGVSNATKTALPDIHKVRNGYVEPGLPWRKARRANPGSAASGAAAAAAAVTAATANASGLDGPLGSISSSSPLPGAAAAGDMDQERMQTRLLSLPDIVCRSANGDIFLVNLSGVQQMLHERELGEEGLQQLGRISPSMVDTEALRKVRERQGVPTKVARKGKPWHQSDVNSRLDTDATTTKSGAAARASIHEEHVDEVVQSHLRATECLVEALRTRLNTGSVSRVADSSAQAAEEAAREQAEKDAAVAYCVQKYLPKKLTMMAHHVRAAPSPLPRLDQSGVLFEKMRAELSPEGMQAVVTVPAASNAPGWSMLRKDIRDVFQRLPFMDNWNAEMKKLRRAEGQSGGWDELVSMNDLYVKGGSNGHQGSAIFTQKCQEMGVVACTQVVQQLNHESANMAHCKLGRRGAGALRHALAVNSTITELNLSDNGLDARGIDEIIQGLCAGTRARQPAARKKLDNRWAKLDFLVKKPDFVVTIERPPPQAAVATAPAAAGDWGSRPNSGGAGESIVPGGGGGLQEGAARGNSPFGRLGSFQAALGRGASPDALALLGPDPRKPVPLPAPTKPASKMFSNITSLDLSDNPLGVGGVRAIADLLDPSFAPVQFLKTLAMNKCGVPDTGGLALVKALANSNQVLQSLHLNNNQLGNAAAAAFGELLGANSTLTELDLSWNQIKPEGTKDIAAGLKENNSLTHLSLAWNGCENEGVDRIGHMLTTNATLRSLDLTNTRMGAEACLMLGEGIRGNTVLEVLILNANSVGDDGARHLMNALKQNNSLRYLGLQGTNMTSATRGQGAASDFNPLSPDGSYTLRLADVVDRATALQLCQLDRASETDLMRNIRLDGRNINSAKSQNWPDTLPISGTLNCDFASRRTRKVMQVMEAKKFHALQNQLSGNAMSDKEKLSLVEVMAPFTYLYCHQIAEILRTFTMGEEVVRAAAVLFTRCCDLDENVYALTDALSEHDQLTLHEMLAWYAYLRFTNVTGHYELNLSLPVHQHLATRLKDLAYSEDDCNNWINIVHDQYSSALKVPGNFGPPDSWKGLVPAWGSISFDYVSSVTPPDDCVLMSDADFDAFMETEICILFDQYGQPLPEMNFDAADDQVAQLRPLCSNMAFTCAQVNRLVSAFSAGPHRVEVVIVTYALITDRKNLWTVHQTLKPLEQACMMWRLGPANVFDPQHPTGHYILDIANPAHEALAKRLVEMALHAPEMLNFYNLRLQGQLRGISENRNMWGTFTAETFTPFMEFDFIGHDGFDVLGRQKADIEVMAMGERVDLRNKQAARMEMERTKQMYAYWSDSSGWVRPMWQSRTLLFRPLLDKAPWMAAWDKMMRILIRSDIRSGDVAGESPLEDLYDSATGSEEFMAGEEFDACLKSSGYNRHEVAHFRALFEAAAGVPEEDPDSAAVIDFHTFVELYMKEPPAELRFMTMPYMAPGNVDEGKGGEGKKKGAKSPAKAKSKSAVVGAKGKSGKASEKKGKK